MTRLLAWAAVWLAAMVLAGCGGGAVQPQPIHLESASDGYEASLEISPGIVGANRYVLRMKDGSGHSVAGQKAVLHFSMSGMSHGKSEETLTPGGDGTWQGDGPHLMMPGAWHADVEWIDDRGGMHRFSYAFHLTDAY